MDRLVLGIALVAACSVEEHPDWLAPDGTTSGVATGTGTTGTGTTGTGTTGTATTSGATTGSTSGITTDPTSGTTGSTGGADDTGTGGGPAVHTIFVTSSITGPDLGTLAAADAFCQGLADQQNLGGTYRAILSTVAEPASSRISITGPVENIVGDLIAIDEADLWDGSLTNPINYDEGGQPHAGASVWTGTLASGDATGIDCNAWTGNGNAEKGIRGAGDSVSAGWTNLAEAPCNQNARLYCISQ